MAAETVTFTLPSGSKVTCSKELADKIRGSKAPAKKAASSKSEK